MRSASEASAEGGFGFGRAPSGAWRKRDPTDRLPAEEAIDPLQDQIRLVLHLDRRRSLDPQHERRGLGWLAVHSPPPLQLDRLGVSGNVGADDVRPARDQFGRCEALLGEGFREEAGRKLGQAGGWGGACSRPRALSDRLP